MCPMEIDDEPSQELQPFRILDLPPELRNIIYEAAFQDYHALSPHPLTHVNRQLRSDSLSLFYEERQTIDIEVKTPKQMTCVLNWLDNSTPKDTKNVSSICFNYPHPTNGLCRVLLHREIVSPAEIQRTTIAEMHAKGLFCDKSAPTEAMLKSSIAAATWRASNGILDNPLFDTHCYTYNRDLATPPQPFWDAVMTGSDWTSYRVELLDNFTRVRCFCSPLLKRFALMVRSISGNDWEGNKPELRKMAYDLFQSSMKAKAHAETQAEAQAPAQVVADDDADADANMQDSDEHAQGSDEDAQGSDEDYMD